MSSDNRKIWWRFLIYPESAREDWREFIYDSSCEEYFISPCHDQDIDEETGEPLKPHYHVVVHFNKNHKVSLKQLAEEYEQIGAVIDKRPINAPKHGSIVSSPEKAVQYLTHYNKPKKHQYDRNEIDYTRGVDLDKFFKTNKDDNTTTIGEMLQFIKERKIHKYAEFVDVCLQENLEWFSILCNSRASNFINEYLKSKYPPAYFNRKYKE